MTDDRFRNVLAQSVTASHSAGACPDAEHLAAFVERALGHSERDLCLAHLAACATCQAHVAALVRTQGVETDVAGLGTGSSPINWPPRWSWLPLAVGTAVVVLAVRTMLPVAVPPPASPQTLGSDSERPPVVLPRDAEPTVTPSDLGAEAARSAVESDEFQMSAGAERELVRARADLRPVAPTGQSVARLEAETSIDSALSDRSARLAEFEPPLVIAPGGAVRWRALPGGTIEVSVDGGARWTAQFRREGVDWIAGSAPTTDICWWVGVGGHLVRTSDGGATWTNTVPPRDAVFVGVRARDGETAEVSHANGQVSITSDGGETWVARP